MGGSGQKLQHRKCSMRNMRRNFFVVQTAEAQRGCGVYFSWRSQKPCGHNPEQYALGWPCLILRIPRVFSLKIVHCYIAVREVHLCVPKCWLKEYTGLVNFIRKVELKWLFVLIYFGFFVCVGFTLPSSKLTKFMPSLYKYDVPKVGFFDCCYFSLLIPSSGQC